MNRSPTQAKRFLVMFALATVLVLLGLGLPGPFLRWIEPPTLITQSAARSRVPATFSLVMLKAA